MAKKYAVFFNGDAPPGWVEIQAEDEHRPRITDGKAAGLAAKKGGMPGCDMLLHCDSGCMVRNEGDPAEALSHLDTFTAEDSEGHVIYVIPAKAALAAKLLTTKQARAAAKKWT